MTTISRQASFEPPKWAKLFAWTYVGLFWALPICMTPFFNILPYAHSHPFYMRLLVSVIGSTGFMSIVIAFSPVNYSSYFSAFSVSTKAKSILGLIMFTLAAAALSANVFGAAVVLTPGQTYQSTTEVLSASYKGSRHRRFESVSLELRDIRTGEIRYLELSKALFDYPHINPRDILPLTGKQNIFGVYVQSVGYNTKNTPEPD